MKILDDDRPIVWVEMSPGGEEATFWRVGYDGVTSIVPYEENGQGAAVPWLEIYKDDVVAARANCALAVGMGYD